MEPYMKIALLLVIVIVLGAMAYVRLAPSDPARWNVDPVTANDPGKAGVLLAPGTLRFELPPDELLTLLDGVIRAHSGTETLAGVPGDHQITYVVRSKWLGIPDYLTVRALPDGETGSTLAAVSRLRFGVSDFGVNRARLDSILSQVRQLAQ